jgi:hypothetical protein
MKKTEALRMLAEAPRGNALIARQVLTTVALLLLVLLAVSDARAQGSESGVVLFDDDWRFQRGGAQGAEGADFDDSVWRRLDLPHDWSIEDLPGTRTPFDPAAISQVQGGYTVGGTGWYRKSFDVPASRKGRRVLIQFDGVYMNAEVWLNGQRVGEHPYGYTSFWFDLTDKGENSRWYSGSGIYRHVWLKTLDPVHIAQWGTYVTTPEVSASSAKVNLKTRVSNESEAATRIRLVTRLLDPAGAESARVEDDRNVEAKGSYEFEQMRRSSCPRSGRPTRPRSTRPSSRSTATAVRPTASRRGSASAPSPSTWHTASASTARRSSSRAAASTTTTALWARAHTTARKSGASNC